MWVQTGAYQSSSLFWLIALIVVFVIALIALFVAMAALSRARVGARAGTAQSQAAALGPESNRMLDERYARGEISREEYMQRQTDLKSKP
jgi:uncharacterized membrane protein